MKRITVSCAAVSAAFLLCVSIATTVSAEVSSAVTGTVSVSTGALIPGVDITATNVNTGIVTTALTNETGSYTLPCLQPGAYRLTAALSGFQTASYSNVQLCQGQQIRLNFSLQIG